MPTPTFEGQTVRLPSGLHVSHDDFDYCFEAQMLTQRALGTKLADTAQASGSLGDSIEMFESVLAGAPRHLQVFTSGRWAVRTVQEVVCNPIGSMFDKLSLTAYRSRRVRHGAPLVGAAIIGEVSGTGWNKRSLEATFRFDPNPHVSSLHSINIDAGREYDAIGMALVSEMYQAHSSLEQDALPIGVPSLGLQA